MKLNFGGLSLNECNFISQKLIVTLVLLLFIYVHETLLVEIVIVLARARHMNTRTVVQNALSIRIPASFVILGR